MQRPGPGQHQLLDPKRNLSDSETVDVTIASINDPAPFAPQKAIFLEDKLPWV
jgi:hypothetical protein